MLTRDDLGGLGNLANCDGISLLGGNRITDGFLHRQYLDSFKKMALRKLLRINHNAHYRMGVIEYNV